ncbi:hypothetical protein ADL35_05535, partial [Streptomyces sp. NRRL WC-3753]
TATEVVVELRKPPLELFGAKSGGTPANIIRFRVDGDTGIRAELMLRKPDADGTPVTVPVGIDFERVLGRQQLPYEAVLLGATAGRTTLTGEGLQHADGHSQLLASTNPAVVAYDPAFGYEIAHIVQD